MRAGDEMGSSVVKTIGFIPVIILSLMIAWSCFAYYSITLKHYWSYSQPATSNVFLIFIIIALFFLFIYFKKIIKTKKQKKTKQNKQNKQIKKQIKKQ